MRILIGRPDQRFCDHYRRHSQLLRSKAADWKARIGVSPRLRRIMMMPIFYHT